MTQLEKVAKVLATADGGCPPCVKRIAREWISEFNDATPEQMADALLKVGALWGETREKVIEELSR